MKKEYVIAHSEAEALLLAKESVSFENKDDADFMFARAKDHDDSIKMYRADIEGDSIEVVECE